MSRRTEYMEHLAAVPMFSALAKKDLKVLARHSDESKYAEGDVLVSEGDRGDEFFVIAEGTAKVSRGGRKVAELSRGDFFGELALLDGAPRNATVTATSPLVAVRLNRKDFDQVLADVPSVAFKLGVGLARRLREADQKALH